MYNWIWRGCQIVWTQKIMDGQWLGLGPGEAKPTGVWPEPDSALKFFK